MHPYFRLFRFRFKRLVLIGLLCTLYLTGYTLIIVSTNSSPRTSNSTPKIVELELTETTKGLESGPSETVAVLLLFCDRPTVNRTLEQILRYRPSVDRFPLIVSQDCGDRGDGTVETLKKMFAEQNIKFIKHPKYADVAKTVLHENIPSHLQGYFHIASHYGWALNYTFNVLDFNNVIIIEDDLDISPDFFEYFEATLPLLRMDETLWCVSAYNDNGQRKLINMSAPELLHRTDFFPGLGWMMTKNLWKELMGKWPGKFWDDWMREPEQRRGRACIRPEISRSKTFGRVGVSNGEFYDLFLKTIVLNTKYVPFRSKVLSYLTQTSYDSELRNRIASTVAVSSLQELDNRIHASNNTDDAYRLRYLNEKHFSSFTSLGMMTDFKVDVPRTGYKGVVSILYRARRVYLVSNRSLLTK